MAGQIPVAFAAGLLSFLAPCVLPLVPGYLSAVSAVDPARLGDRGAARHVFVSSIPFVVGFTTVFVALGTGVAAAGGLLSSTSQQEIAGFVVVVFGLAFMGLLPWPERLVAPGLLSGARRTRSNVLLGGAFGVCAAPCIGPVLASILALAGSRGTVLQGSVLLLVYSVGLAVPFLVTGVAFARAMSAFRWLRDRYRAIQFGSGAILVAIGLLLFFDRFWWLRVAVDHALNAVGIDG
jgi:cytochrome c-type biogenesis protein